MLPRWVFTVLSEMCSSAPISALVRPRRERQEHVLLALGQRGDGRLRRLRPHAAEVGQEADRDRRRHECIAHRRGTDRLHEERGAGVLQEEAAGPVGDRGAHVLVEVERGDDDHRDRVGDLGPGQEAGGGEPVQLGHADVEQAHVRAQPLGELHRLASVGRLADDLDAVGLEDEAEARAHHRLVVRDHDAERLGHVGLPERQPRLDAPAAAVDRPGLEAAAQRLGPLGHADEAVAGATGTRAPRGGAVVVDHAP